MKNILASGILAVFVLGSAPVYAETVGVAGSILSYVEFQDIPENHGIHGRLLDQKYDAYRSGRVPQTTLSTSNIR